MASVPERPPRAAWGTQVALWPGCVQWSCADAPGPAECFVDLSRPGPGPRPTEEQTSSHAWHKLASLHRALPWLNTLVSFPGLASVAGLDLCFWDADVKRLLTQAPWTPPPSSPQHSAGLRGGRTGRPLRVACVLAVHTATAAMAAAHRASPLRRAWVAVCLQPAMVTRGP